MKVNNTTGDIAAEDAVGYDRAAEKGAAPYVNVRSDGSVDTNFAWNIPQSEIDKLLPALKDAAMLRDDLMAQIQAAKDGGQPNLAASLEGQLAKLDGALAKLKAGVESSDSFQVMVRDSTTIVAQQLGKTLSNVVASLRENDQSGLLNVPAESAKDLSAATGTSEAVGKMSDTELSAFTEHVVTSDAGEIAKEFGADPKGMWDKLSQLTPDDRQFALMKLQQGVQENNQLFSMLTNFMKATHDTEKAIVSNLRV